MNAQHVLMEIRDNFSSKFNQIDSLHLNLSWQIIYIHHKAPSLPTYMYLPPGSQPLKLTYPLSFPNLPKTSKKLPAFINSVLP